MASQRRYSILITPDHRHRRKHFALATDIDGSCIAVWDIESGLWASPFFGAFSALRFFSLALLGQLLLIIVAVYTTDGLAFPGCEYTSRVATHFSPCDKCLCSAQPRFTNLKTTTCLCGGTRDRVLIGNGNRCHRVPRVVGADDEQALAVAYDCRIH